MRYEGDATVWYDVETSGLYANKNEIIQFAAIAVDSHALEILEKFECKLQFSIVNASHVALKNNSYDEKVWDIEAVPQGAAFHLFDTFLQKYKTWKRVSKKSGKSYQIAELAGHNLQFDNDFLKAFYSRNGNGWVPASAWRGGYIDTLDIAKTIQIMSGERWEDGFQLGVLCKRFGVVLDNAHDALADIEATIELYKKLRETIVIDDRYIMSGMNPEETLNMGAFTEPEKTTEFLNDR